MIPKSNVKLVFGDVCFIPRDDGRFAPFIYLLPVARSRSYYYGALGLTVSEAPLIEELPEQLQIGEHALVHIHCYAKNQTPLAGNLSCRLDSTLLAEVTEITQSTRVGTSRLVWGHRTILKRANLIET